MPADRLSRDDDVMTGTTAVSPEAPHEWTRLVRGWHAAFWVMMGLAYLWLLISAEVSGPRRWVGLATVTVLVVAYVVLLQRSPAGTSPRRTSWRWAGYLVIAVVAAGVACAVNPTLGMLLFVVYSQVWMFTPTVRIGAAFAVALTGSALLGFMSHEGFSLAGLRDLGPRWRSACCSACCSGYGSRGSSTSPVTAPS
jgi:hypothetical protein